MEPTKQAGGEAAFGQDASASEERRIGIKALGPFGWNVVVEDARHGAFIVNPNDQYVGRSLLLYREYSEFEVDLFRELLAEGAVVVEAGSNIGAHTIPLARMVGGSGVVFAFEPQRLAYQMLAGTASLNGVANVKTYNSALGAAAGEISVPVMDPQRKQNFGGLELKPGAKPSAWSEQAAVMTVDQMCLGKLDLLKIDVEGMEGDVLRGALATIATTKPAIYLEADREARTRDIEVILGDMDYRAWWHFPPLFNPRNHAKRAENVFGPVVSINLLALPASRAGAGEKLLSGATFLAGDTWKVAMERIKRSAT